MAIAYEVSLEEYLRTEYEPDCDYVDGVLVERNAGQKKHGETQALVAAYFVLRRKPLGIRVATELRMRVSTRRVRVPDVAIVDAEDTDEVNQKPPLLCIEVLSPDDRPSRLARVIADYLAFGVPTIWIIDPYDPAAFVVTQQNPAMQPLDELRWNDVVLRLSEILPE